MGRLRALAQSPQTRVVLPPADDPCAHFGECGACVDADRCVWCEDGGGSCVQAGADAGTWTPLLGACHAWDAFGDRCTTRRTDSSGALDVLRGGWRGAAAGAVLVFALLCALPVAVHTLCGRSLSWPCDALSGASGARTML